MVYIGTIIAVVKYFETNVLTTLSAFHLEGEFENRLFAI